TRFSRDWSSDVCSSDLGIWDDTDPGRTVSLWPAADLRELAYRVGGGATGRHRGRQGDGDDTAAAAYARRAAAGPAAHPLGAAPRSEERRVGKEGAAAGG